MFKINISDDFYCVSNTIDTNFYVNIENECFPDSQWVELAITVLYMWTSNLINNGQKDIAYFELCFLEGPFFIRCNKDKGKVSLTGIKRSLLEESVCCQTEVAYSTLVSEIVSASTQLIELIKKHKLGSLRDLKNLKATVKHLRQL